MNKKQVKRKAERNTDRLYNNISNLHLDPSVKGSWENLGLKY